MFNLKEVSINLFLISLVTSVVYVNLYLTGSSLSSSEALAYELVGEAKNWPVREWIEQWMWQQESPYKFRILGKWLVWITFHALETPVMGETAVKNLFYQIFIVWGWLWLIATVISLYVYLKWLWQDLARSSAWWTATLGSVLFLTAPPILMAFKFPVHTSPNDLLGYFFMVIGMMAIVTRHSFVLCIISSIAVFCRETLLLLPFIYLITSDDKWLKRLLLSSFPVITWVTYRIVWWEAYVPSTGAYHNLLYPYETLGFLFLIFGGLWLPGLAGFFQFKTALTLTRWQPLIKSFPMACLLVLGFNLMFARIREIRISFVLFVFILPLALWWVSQNINSMYYILRKWWYWTYLLLLTILSGWGGMILTHPLSIQEYGFYMQRFGHLYGGFGGGWVEIMMIYFWIAMAGLPLLFGKYLYSSKN